MQSLRRIGLLAVCLLGAPAAQASDCAPVCSGGSCTMDCPSQIPPAPSGSPLSPIPTAPGGPPSGVTVYCATSAGVCTFQTPEPRPRGSLCYCGPAPGTSSW